MVKFNFQCILKCVKQVAVEPVVFLTFFAMGITGVVQQVGTYRVMCYHQFESMPEIDCERPLDNITINGQSAEIILQQTMSMWSMGISMASLIPSMIMDIFLGAYGDRYGRKMNMLLGTIGLIISQLTYIIIYTFPVAIPLYVLVISSLISGFTGSTVITVITAYAYLADTVLNPKRLTLRLVIVGLIMSMAGITGPYIGAASARILTRAQVMLIALGVTTLAFLYCMCCIPQIPPAQLRRRLKETTTESGEYNETELKSNEENKSLIRVIFELLKETFQTIFKRREGNARLYLACVCFSALLSIISELGVKGSIFGMYVQKSPLNWDQGMIGYFKMTQAAISMVSGLMGILIFKKLFHFNITFIILLCSLTDIGEMIILAFSTRTWLIYLSAMVSSFSSLAAPCLQTFLAKTVATDEIGKVYTLFGLTASIGLLLAGVIYNPIYYATVDFLPGFVFLFSTGILTIRFLVMFWMHVDANFVHSDADVGFWKKLAMSVFTKRDEDKTESTAVIPSPVA